MEQRKQRTKQQALGALITITKKLDDSEVRRVADICQGMVLAKQVNLQQSRLNKRRCSMKDLAKKQEVLKALDGLSYNDWLEIKFKADNYFREQMKVFESQMRLDSKVADAKY